MLVEKLVARCTQFEHLDRLVVRWMARYSVSLMRVGLGLIFFWFGILKFFPGLSPAEGLALRTMERLTLGWVPASASLIMLATWECLIGLGLMTGRLMRTTIFLLLAQMAGTVLPLLFFPEEAFTWMPLVPTLEGQYIIKNIVLVSAALVIGATVRGGRVLTEPGLAAGSTGRAVEHNTG